MEYVDHILTDQSVYRIRDPEAARVDNQKVGQTVWDSQALVERLCPAFTVSGQQVVCHPVEGYPLSVATVVSATQEGEGVPSPENLRPIAGCTALQLQHRTDSAQLDYSYRLGEALYGGSFNWTAGIVEETHRLFTLDETADLRMHLDGRRYYLNGGLPDMKVGNSLPGLCDSLPVLAADETTEQPALQLGLGDNNFYLWNMEKLDSAIVDAESLKAYLAQHPIRFLYPLAETCRYRVEPVEIVALAGENALESNAGLTVVSGRKVPPYMEQAHV